MTRRLIKTLTITIMALALTTSNARSAPWKFIAVCDSRGSGFGVNQPILGEIVSETLKHNPEFLLFPGDLIWGFRPGIEPELLQWRDVMMPLYNADIPVYAGRGNHEMDGGADWIKVFGSSPDAKWTLPDNGPPNQKYMTYSVTHNNATILMLDNYGGINNIAKHSVNQKWLDEQLLNNTKQHVFVAGHELAFKGYHSDSLDDFPDKRDTFWNSIANAGARTYFCGHDHFYAHALIDDGDGNTDNDIHQLVVGTAGASLYSTAFQYDGLNSHFTVQDKFYAVQFGYVIVEVDDLNVTITWMQRDDAEPGFGGYWPAESFSYTVKPPIVNIPDQALRSIVTEKLTIDEPNTADMLNLHQLTASDASITDLTGLKWAFNLSSIDLSQNNITDLTSIQNLANVEMLNLTENPLSIEAICSQLPKIVDNNPQITLDFSNPLLTDCQLNFNDFTIIAQQWQNECSPANNYCDGADLDLSGSVGLTDMAIIAQDWLFTK